MAGRGGQGVLLLGRVLGLAASKYYNLFATCSEAYVAETRGGDSRVDMIIATNEDEIDYIKVRKADIALFLHQEQLMRFGSLVGSNAKVFIDETFLKEIPRNVEWQIFKAPYTQLAEHEFRTTRVSNMVALGHLIGTLKLIPKNFIENAIDELVSSEWRETNKAAFNFGLRIQ
ncbi:MAG: 2-oxoacid:acceptor oxidoreductase family protein [Sulfolobales archaeon]|nr:2-oxoacid:acceptor oxidoreductase family protein [Sulfolobales archaeon]MCX8185859.1 2-oxoacid:acceptor oxidoreductase family protein [Sulfolobales archaeon]